MFYNDDDDDDDDDDDYFVLRPTGVFMNLQYNLQYNQGSHNVRMVYWWVIKQLQAMVIIFFNFNNIFTSQSISSLSSVE